MDLNHSFPYRKICLDLDLPRDWAFSKLKDDIIKTYGFLEAFICIRIPIGFYRNRYYT